ncbi:hypothetical protein GUJ93_ZPchr0001g31969 [Zizania palustris]|uniref:Uncharacterized protein n=1 Tax=Zizania palustris TaxID=103762 RepID=A0A8J5V317_ZIZPA|nr:hypothetical protein GUJ93_ZPchr0001g31969 [Zizania palustris]
MASARPYRFPVPEAAEPTRRSAAQSCGTCGASAVASCVALCCCPCAVVSCLTLAVVKAPYVAGRRCAARLASKRRRRRRVQMTRPGLTTTQKTNRVWDLDDGLQEWRPADGDVQAEERKEVGETGPGRLAGASPPDDANYAIGAVSEGNDMLTRARLRVDAQEKMWVEIYQLGHWGFGRPSFSQGMMRGDADKDGLAAAAAAAAARQ